MSPIFVIQIVTKFTLVFRIFPEISPKVFEEVLAVLTGRSEYVKSEKI